MRFHGSKRAIHFVGVNGFEQCQQPFVGWKFIIVNEGNVVALCIGDRHISSQRDVLLRLDTIFDWRLVATGKLFDGRSRGLEAIVVSYYDRIGKLVVGLLADQTLQEALQKAEAFVSANANCYVRNHGKFTLLEKVRSRGSV